MSIIKNFSLSFNGARDTVTLVRENSILISDGSKTFCNFPCSHVTGAAFQEFLFYTCENSREIYILNPNTGVSSSFLISGFDSIRVVKFAANAPELLVLQAGKGGTFSYLVLDVQQKKLLFPLPIQSDFIDLAAIGENQIFLLCEHEIDNSLYDDEEDYTVIFSMELSVPPEFSQPTVISRTYLCGSYDSFDERYMERLIYGQDMKFPLFDQFLKHWLIQKSLSSSGQNTVYYCRDFNGIILADRKTGDIFRVFQLPELASSQDAAFYYNDSTDILTVILNNFIMRYRITCNSPDTVTDVNLYYNNFFRLGKSARFPERFESLLSEAIQSCICTNLSVTAI